MNCNHSTPVCAPHQCRCGAAVDIHGLHPLLLGACRLPLHSALNDIKHALSSAGFIAVLEPVGLDCGDGKHPDGMTVIPFSRGKCFGWNSTSVDYFLLSVVALTAIESGPSARSAEVCTSRRSEGLSDRYMFQVIAVEFSFVIQIPSFPG